MTDQNIITAEDFGVDHAVSRYDYSQLPRDVAMAVRQSAARIRTSYKRSAEEYVKAGIELIRVKEALPHGEFGPWLAAEFEPKYNLKQRTADNMMNMAREFGDRTKFAIISNLPGTTLVALAKAPDDVRERFMAANQRGEKVTGAMVRQATKAAQAAASASADIGAEPSDNTALLNTLRDIEADVKRISYEEADRLRKLFMTSITNLLSDLLTTVADNPDGAALKKAVYRLGKEAGQCIHLLNLSTHLHLPDGHSDPKRIVPAGTMRSLMEVVSEIHTMHKLTYHKKKPDLEKLAALADRVRQTIGTFPDGGWDAA